MWAKMKGSLLVAILITVLSALLVKLATEYFFPDESRLEETAGFADELLRGLNIEGVWPRGGDKWPPKEPHRHWYGDQ